MMSKRNKELNVEFIGEQGAELTLQEQQAVSDFIRQRKEKQSHKKSIKTTKASS